ncbi:MAG: CoA pyrophosphatase [Planctomycetota bacterium]|nr:CoA pyrophosphatase [Planctomycetota bacterium]
MSDTIINQLSARLSQPLPGRTVQAALAPALTFGRHFGLPRYDARPAAVMVLLVPRQQSWTVPLMVRPAFARHHAGQIALPGGVIEPGETVTAAALRELHEELGILPEQVQIVGMLSPLYVFSSNHMLSVTVGVAVEPLVYQPNPAEVEQVLELPLSQLAQNTPCETTEYRRGALTLQVPCCRLGEEAIWGATLMILGELLAVIKQLECRQELLR